MCTWESKNSFFLEQNLGLFLELENTHSNLIKLTICHGFPTINLLGVRLAPNFTIQFIFATIHMPH